MLVKANTLNRKRQTAAGVVLGAMVAAAMLPAALGVLQSSATLPELGTSRPDLGKLPLQFEANWGQAAPEVGYMTRNGNNALFFTPGEVALALQGTEAGLKLQFVGANPSHAISSGTQLPGKVNYMIGNDPAQWHTGVPTYGDIHYKIGR